MWLQSTLPDHQLDWAASHLSIGYFISFSCEVPVYVGVFLIFFYEFSVLSLLICRNFKYMQDTRLFGNTCCQLFFSIRASPSPFSLYDVFWLTEFLILLKLNTSTFSFMIKKSFITLESLIYSYLLHLYNFAFHI